MFPIHRLHENLVKYVIAVTGMFGVGRIGVGGQVLQLQPLLLIEHPSRQADIRALVAGRLWLDPLAGRSDERRVEASNRSCR